MDDALSRKIRMLHNDQINNRDCCYIITNETGLEDIQEKLRLCNIAMSCHLGVSGWYNFDLMCITKSSRGIILDYNCNQVSFLKQTLIILKNSYYRACFVEDFIKYLRAMENRMAEVRRQIVHDYGFHNQNIAYNILHDSCTLFYINIKDGRDPIEQVNHELIRNGSWLSTDNNYNYIRNLALQDKICVICEDITNTSNMRRILDLLDWNGITLNTVYLSNAMDYIPDENITSETISLFKRDNSKIIYTNHKSGLKQCIM